MVVLPQDKGGNTIKDNRVIMDTSHAPDFANLDVEAIVVPETGKAVVLLLNWMGRNDRFAPVAAGLLGFAPLVCRASP